MGRMGITDIDILPNGNFLGFFMGNIDHYAQKTMVAMGFFHG